MHWLYNSLIVPHPQPSTLHSYSTSILIPLICKPFFELPEVVDCKLASDAADQISYIMARNLLLCTFIIAPKLAELQHPTSAELIAPICKPFFELPEVVDCKS